jgi:hypothetical protein
MQFIPCRYEACWVRGACKPWWWLFLAMGDILNYVNYINDIPRTLITAHDCTGRKLLASFTRNNDSCNHRWLWTHPVHTAQLNESALLMNYYDVEWCSWYTNSSRGVADYTCRRLLCRAADRGVVTWCTSVVNQLETVAPFDTFPSVCNGIEIHFVPDKPKILSLWSPVALTSWWI